MAQAVTQHQDQREKELSELTIEMDQEKRQKSVAAITSTNYCQELRQRAHTPSPHYHISRDRAY
ncbi:putative sensor with HAMP domain protein [Thermostichus vulcanus NIES-2134]|nr:putative sensor with HAMP domain protein [Thermostichus vulcanus NIES-2134]